VFISFLFPDSAHAFSAFGFIHTGHPFGTAGRPDRVNAAEADSITISEKYAGGIDMPYQVIFIAVPSWLGIQVYPFFIRNSKVRGYPPHLIDACYGLVPGAANSATHAFHGG
jgi:hypothetical protein